jgi:predicted phage gp36 major capsid-like protein
MSSTPIVVDLGATSRKRIRELKRGEGKLKAELQEVIEQIRAQLGADAENKELVPIVLVYSRRKKQPRSATDLIL